MEDTSEIEMCNAEMVTHAKMKLPKFIYLVTALSAVSGLLFGYDTGVVSGAMILLKDHFELSSTWIELVVSSTIGAAWIFSILAGFMTERFGRKPVIILASFVFTVGAVMMGVSQERYLLLSGRIVVGVGIGLSSMTVPMYIGEIAPLEIRGKLLTINSCFITGGQFIASVVDGLFSKDKLNGWRYMLGLAGIPSFIQFFCFLYMPESPRWLISKERYNEAVIILKRVTKSTPEAEREAQSIQSNIHIEKEQQNSEKGSPSTFLRVLKTPHVRRALIVGCSLQMFQQISGINTVMYYSALIIQMSGFDDVSEAIWLAAATASVNFVFTFVGMLLVERIGRRLLILGSLAGVIISLCILAIGFQLANIHSAAVVYRNYTINTDCSQASTCAECINFDSCGYCFQKSPTGPENSSCLAVGKNTEVSSSGNCSSDENTSGDFVWGHEWCPTDYSWLILLGMLLYLLLFAPGMGPMPWTINSELYPQWARSTCYSIATSFTWMFNILISMTFLTLSHSITRYGAFYLYMGFSIVGWLFIFISLPETKGRTFEEVGSQFSHSLCQIKNIYHNENISYEQMESVQKKEQSITFGETSH